MTQGGQRGSGGIVRPNDNPYGGVDRILLSNSTSPDKVFGSNMPTGQTTQPPHTNTGTIYGNDNYFNPNLQGYSQAGQNIINVDQLNNGITPMDHNAINQLRHDNIVQPTSSNLPPAPTGNPNQMYMQPPTIPQIADMQPTQPVQTTATQPQVQRPQQSYHDLSTAEGNLDYLNSIAPTAATKTRNPISSKLFMAAGIGIIVLVVLVAIVGALGNSGNGSLSSHIQDLGKAIANLQSIIDYGESNDRYINSDLAGVTAETSLVILSHQTELSNLVALAVDEDGEATEAEADETTTDDLDTALSQGHLSDVYQQALKERLTAISDATVASYNAASDEDVKTALDETYIDVQNLLNRVDKAVTSSGGEAAD